MSPTMITKGQVSMEFMFLTGFLFIISLGFTIAAGIQLKEYSDHKKSEMVREFGRSVQKEIELASIVHEGYQREIILPEKIYDLINYTISLSNVTLSISADVE